VIYGLRNLHIVERPLGPLGGKRVNLSLLSICWQGVLDLNLLPLRKVSVVSPQVVEQSSKLIRATCHMNKPFGH